MDIEDGALDLEVKAKLARKILDTQAGHVCRILSQKKLMSFSLFKRVSFSAAGLACVMCFAPSGVSHGSFMFL